MRLLLGIIGTILLHGISLAQTPKSYTASELLLQLKKLNVLGSVLYIAAHPDDENTRLLAYLSNEKLLRTGYLSLTRGDGGQNLIGDEQGVELGLIRTQELLAARNIDGAEQFFTTAYDFGFSKSSDEAMAVWNHDKVLADVVWVIRNFKPDVVIARFPEDSRAGHGHHSASGILAREAYEAAADATKFPEQFKNGVSSWQAKRMLWNTFNFGNTNTQKEDQFKIEVGMYNPLLGKSYGELASLSRSQHKSQGFGVPAQRGTTFEYFETIKGSKPVQQLTDEVNITWDRISGFAALQLQIDSIVQNFSALHPEASVPALMRLHATVMNVPDTYWRNKKLEEIVALIERCGGLFIEATTNSATAVKGDSIKFNLTFNNRLGLNITKASAQFYDSSFTFNSIGNNINQNINVQMPMPASIDVTQPYWLVQPMEKGSFVVDHQTLIGKAENSPIAVQFNIEFNNQSFSFIKPIRYKFTDPVKGELYQPFNIIPVAEMKFSKDFYVYQLGDSMHTDLSLIANKNMEYVYVRANEKLLSGKIIAESHYQTGAVKKAVPINIEMGYGLDADMYKGASVEAMIKLDSGNYKPATYHRLIQYDHIPTIQYYKPTVSKLVFPELKIAGKKIGYIPGAGDKVLEALLQMGYAVTTLKNDDLKLAQLKNFDAVVTGIRAYNTNEVLSKQYPELMAYVQQGGVLLVQYNMNNSIGNAKANIAPYPFNITRNRITDENAAVKFLLPNHPALNYPNTITDEDFEGWVQERSIYHAEKIDSNYQRIISMHDPAEADQEGSLIVANYGKGKFVYTGIAFFRQLPAGVRGAYRLFANLLAPPIIKTPVEKKAPFKRVKKLSSSVQLKKG